METDHPEAPNIKKPGVNEQSLGKPSPKHKAFGEECGAWCTEGQCLRSYSATLPSPPHREQIAATGKKTLPPSSSKMSSS